MTPETALALDPETLEDIRIRNSRNTTGFWEHGPLRMDRRWQRWDDVAAADPGCASPYPNSATMLAPIRDEEHAADVAARLNAFYAGGEGGGFLLWSAWPMPDLGRFGFRGPGRPPFMLREAGLPMRPAPPELEVVEVTEAEQLVDWERVLVQGYPAPEMQPFRAGSLYDARVLGGPCSLWLGRLDGTAVTAAAAYVSDGLVGIYAVATLAEARGKGYGSAVTGAATLVDPSLPGMLQASELGTPVYASLGYRTIGEFLVWVKPVRHS